MPGGDGTGPCGRGPGSGWGRGPCGRGMRRGCGFGYGAMGRGMGMMPRALSPEEEKAGLQQLKESLENEVKQIQKRLEELK